MTEQEIKTLKEFEENDKELEDIALHVAEQLDSLKDKAIKTGSEIQGQNELLTKGNRLSFYWGSQRKCRRHAAEPDQAK